VSSISNKRRLASGISVIAIAAALGVATPAMAQSESATLQGHVDGAKPGTPVVAVDTHTGQRSTGTVDAKGNYAILGLRPSDYTVTVAGQAAQTASLQVGQTVTVDFAAAAGPGNAIVVTGRRVAAPTQAQTVATNITPAQIENLPQNSRNFLSFAILAPGVTLSNPSGAQQFQVGALNADHSNVLLDGMSFKNPVNHGGMFGQNFGSFGNPFPQVAIQEYQVETQNFGAEVGNSAGGVLNAVTKTGGDHFHGSAFIDWQPKAFITKPFFTSGPKQDFDRKQFGGEFGGPIIPGKLTFYVAAEGVSQRLPAGSFNVTASVPQNIANEVNGAVPQNFHQGLYFGKLTYFMDPENTFNLIGYARRQSNLSDYGGNAAASHGHLLSTHQTRFQLQWRHSAGNFLNLLNMSYDKAENGTPTVSNGPEYILTGAPTCTPGPTPPATTCNTGDPNISGTGAAQVFLGNNSFVQDDNEKAWVVKDDATYRAGDHTFKAGAQVTFYDLSRTVADHFNGTYYVQNPCPNSGQGSPPPACNIGNFDITTAAPYAGQVNIQPSPTLSGKDTLIGIYAEDEWKPDLHWTVNAGLRWDFESNPNDTKYVTPPAIAAALRAYPGWQARGINPEDYISNGHNRHPEYNHFQPRLGVAYDVHGDHDMIIFGGAGRYYDESLFIEGQIEQQQNSSVVLNTVNLSAAGFSAACSGASPPAFCSDPDALRQLIAAQGSAGAVWVLPNKLKTPYSDQFDLGIRKRFGDIQASLTYSHVESHNLFLFARANFYNNGWYSVVLTPTGCVNGGDAWINDNVPNGPFPNCPVSGAQLPGFNGKLDRGLDNGRARLDAIYLHIEKPFTDKSVWGFTESVTLQRARTNVGQDPFNQDEMFNGTELDVFGWNYVPNVPKWNSVTSATFRAPWGFTLSGILSLNSGPAFGHIFGFGGANNPQGACCVGNFSGVYFPHKTIGYKRLDMRVAKTFKTPWGHELTVDFQAFNVFNWLNRTYSTWGAGSGSPPPLTEHGALANDQRQFQVGASYKF
jgi:outer membrane receptor protein involved in Fe transport